MKFFLVIPDAGAYPDGQGQSSAGVITGEGSDKGPRDEFILIRRYARDKPLFINATSSASR